MIKQSCDHHMGVIWTNGRLAVILQTYETLADILRLSSCVSAKTSNKQFLLKGIVG